MFAEIAAAIGPFASTHAIPADATAGAVQLLGTSGTVTTIAGIHLGLPRYDRDRVDGLRLGFADVRAVIETVVNQDYAARAAQPCIGPGRGDVMVAGCAILDAVMAACPAGRLDVADRGLREGMLLRLMRVAQAARRGRR